MSASTSENIRRTTKPLPRCFSWTHLGARGAGDLSGFVRRIVVEYENYGGWERGTEVFDNLGNCRLLVVAGHQNGNPVRAEAVGGMIGHVALSVVNLSLASLTGSRT